MARSSLTFRHEKESGFYRVSAYFIAKLLCDLLPMTVIPVPLYCGITYWMIGNDISSKFDVYLQVDPHVCRFKE